MNKKRRQAYLNLIQSLFSCRSDDEATTTLQANLELLDDDFAEFLRKFATKFLADLDADEADSFANFLNYLSIIFATLQQGRRASNLEIAIICNKIALTVWTRDCAEQVVILTFYLLIENGLYQIASLLMQNYRNVYRAMRANTQYNLANDYSDRIKGDRGDNLEMAIGFSEAALQVYTRQDFPQYWAGTQNNLATAYRNRIKGDSGDNLEMAIAFAEAALKVYTRQAFSQDWAGTQIILGQAYLDRIKGDKRDNLEMAIAFSEAALQIYTHQAFPQDWAGTQNNLGEAYRVRINGDRGDNLEMAIAFYEAALQVYTCQAFPQDWAMTQNNLAIAYSDRINGDRGDNLEIAIKCYKAALQIYTRQAFPQYWAMTQHNLATTYSDRINGDRGDNLEMAIQCYKAALQVYTCQAFPQYWAGTQNNLAGAYRDRINGDRGDNLEMAIKCYKAALEFRTPTTLPLDCLLTAQNLGNLGFAESLWETAIFGYEKAIEAVEQSREWVTSDRRKQEIIEENLDVYENMVKCCINHQQYDRALQTVERSKSRYLVELFTKSKIESKTATESGIALTQKVESIDIAKFQKTLDPETAIVEWYIGNSKFEPKDENWGGLAFMFTCDAIEIVVLTATKLAELETWKNDYLNEYRDKAKQKIWQQTLSDKLQKLSEILRLDEIVAKIPNDCRQLILVPHRYLHLFPLHALPFTSQTRFTQETMFRGNLLDCFPGGVKYAPSLQLLQILQNRIKTRTSAAPELQPLFAIQNPTEDLSNADMEVETIKTRFNPHQILLKKQATKTALNENRENLSNANYLHFSCHGVFNFDNPLLSSLVLADSLEPQTSPPPPESNQPDEKQRYVTLRSGRKAIPEKCLTLREIFAELQLPQCSLVTLSACETGLTTSTAMTDEYIGLPSGFLYAGSMNVVSSLWAVDDFATAILMIKFYQELPDADSVAIALNAAQNWMRGVSLKDFQVWMGLLNLDEKCMETAKEWLSYSSKDKPPFQDPEYWAAFCATGY